MNNAIIILNYNDYVTTEKLVDLINRYEALQHIIIVDNCSKDDSYKHMKEKYKKINKIDVIKNKENRGYANGNNYGVKYAIEKYKIEFLFIANPDIMFEEYVINEIQQVLISDKKIGIVAPKVNIGYNSWKLPTYTKTITSMFLLLNKKFGNQVYKKQDDVFNYVDVVAGSFFAMTTKTYMEIQGLDEDTFLYYEENILGLKIKQIGKKNIILGNVQYEHNHATSIKKIYKSKIPPFLIIVNSIKIYNKKYLKIGKMKQIIFNIFFMLALIERYMYNFAIKIKLKGENKC